MSKKAVYKTYQEENEIPKIDLTITQSDDLFDVSETVHNVKIEGISSDELNLVLNELSVPETVKLEIKKTIFKNQEGILDNTRRRFEELIPRLKDDAEYVANDFEIEYHQFEKKIREQLEEVENSINKFFDKF